VYHQIARLLGRIFKQGLGVPDIKVPGIDLDGCIIVAEVITN
jgi:hypothetical protein